MDGKTLDGLSRITVNEEAAVEEALVVVFNTEKLWILCFNGSKSFD